MNRPSPISAIAGLVALTAVAACQPVRPEYDGANLFRGYCASCHGMDATGTGPLSSSLNVRPPNLTTLEARYGEFPRARVAAVIDGRGMRSVHGTAEMPVWGWAFYDAERAAGEAEARELADARIDALVAYLQSIQVED